MLVTLSNIFGSVLIRLLLIFGALAAMTGAAIVVGWMVFQSIATGMTALTDQNLPVLETSADAVDKVDKIKAVLAEILVAQTQSSLGDLTTRADGAAGVLSQSLEQLPASKSQLLLAKSDAVAAALGQLAGARQDKFRSASESAAAVARASTLATEASALLGEVSDTAFSNMIASGDRTIATVDETLSSLIDREFALYQSMLAVRAEMNLLSGVGLSVAQTNDAALLSILNDLADGAVDGLKDLIPAIAASPSTKALALSIEEARVRFEQSFARKSARLSSSEILSLRQALDSELSTALDDIYFELIIKSDDAKAGNEEAIRSLLDVQVAQMRKQADLDAATQSFFAAIMQVALSATDAELAVKQAHLIFQGENLRVEMAEATPEITEKLEAMLALADPKQGIAAKRASYFAADRNAAEMGQGTALAVGEIAADIAAFAMTAQKDISATAQGLGSQVQTARTQMIQIGIAALVLVLIAPGLIWIMVTRPLKRVTMVTERLASGDLSEIVGFRAKTGEIGRLSAALTVFRTGALERIALQEEEKRREAEARKAERTAEQERRDADTRSRNEAEQRAREEQERVEKEQQKEEETRASAEAERQARAAEQEGVVTELARGLQRLSNGDLTHVIVGEFPGGYKALQDDYNAAVSNLAVLIRRIGETAGSIDGSSCEIASSSLDLAKRTESAAATLEETAAAITELTANVSSAAKGASGAAKTVETVKEDTANSHKVMHEAVAAMGEIEGSAAKITKIVEVIDAIAFQTNLLALNAGVEAARAGTAGRGFAVVASEVRVLAQRCSEAALEINGLIENSNGNVERGVALIDQASGALDTINSGILKLTAHVSEIATSANEQSAGIGEINSAVLQLDQSTQQNAAMFEETTAASQALTEESSVLAQIVSGFVVSESALPFDENPGAAPDVAA